MSSSTNEKASADLKAALEAIAGHTIDVSAEQLQQQIINTIIPFSSYSFTPQPTEQFQTNVGEVVSRGLVAILPPCNRIASPRAHGAAFWR